MPDWLKTIFRPLFSKVHYESWEWTLMRLAFAWFGIYKGTPLDLPYHAQPDPAGIAQFVDVTWITSSPWQSVLTILFYGLIFLYCINRLPLIATGGLLTIQTLAGTLGNSQGATHHTTQIVGFVLLGQVLAHVYWKLRRQNNKALTGPAPPSSLIYLSQQLLAAGYVASGISKIVRSRGNWISDTANFPVQLAKGRDKQYYDFLVETPAETGAWMLRLLTDYPALAKALLGTGLFLELFAFLALLNRPLLALFGIGLLAMHATISEFMGLGFAFNKAALLIFFINVPWWLVRLFESMRGELTSPR